MNSLSCEDCGELLRIGFFCFLGLGRAVIDEAVVFGSWVQGETDGVVSLRVALRLSPRAWGVH